MKEELGSWIANFIQEFVTKSPENNMRNEMNERAWAEPLVGFSNGSDPIYNFYKEDIGSFFLTPIEWFNLAYPDTVVKSNELTVISWILPQTQITKAEHRLPRKMPTERWARARIFGEAFNVKLRKHVVETLRIADYDSVSPMNHQGWKRYISDKYNFASNWSERHAAYAAGLGTFGLCDGLITPKGKAMRAGSVIAKIDIASSPRLYENHNAYCLWYAKGACKECVAKCPANAISELGHDKERCSAYLKVTRKFVENTFKFEGYGCGLCQTGVACESSIPKDLKY
jgi:hypothetical protein